MKEKYQVFISKVTQYFKRSTLRDNTLKVTRDWNYLLGLMVVAIVAFCGIGVYVFFFAEPKLDDMEKDSVFVNTTFSKTEFEQILQTHKDRTSTFMDLRDNRPTTPDLGIKKKVVVVEVEEDAVEEEVEEDI